MASKQLMAFSKNALLSSMKSKQAALVKIGSNNITTSAVRRTFENEIHEEHIPYTGFGYEMQGLLHSRYKLTLFYMLFFGSAFSYPFFALHYQKLRGE